MTSDTKVNIGRKRRNLSRRYGTGHLRTDAPGFKSDERFKNESPRKHIHTCATNSYSKTCSGIETQVMQDMSDITAQESNCHVKTLKI